MNRPSFKHSLVFTKTVFKINIAGIYCSKQTLKRPEQCVKSVQN